MATKNGSEATPNYAPKARVACLEDYRQLPEVSRKADLDPARAASVRFGRQEKWPGNVRYRGKGWALSLFASGAGNSQGPFLGIFAAR